MRNTYVSKRATLISARGDYGYFYARNDSIAVIADQCWIPLEWENREGGIEMTFLHWERQIIGDIATIGLGGNRPTNDATIVLVYESEVRSATLWDCWTNDNVRASDLPDVGCAEWPYCFSSFRQVAVYCIKVTFQISLQNAHNCNRRVCNIHGQLRLKAIPSGDYICQKIYLNSSLSKYSHLSLIESRIIWDVD